MEIIQSSKNSNFKHIYQLINSHNYRNKHKQTILEGIHLVQAWSNAGILPTMSIISENYYLTNINTNKPNFDKYLHNPIVISINLWKIITNLPDDDILWIINTKANNNSIDEELIYYQQNCGIILDNIQDSGNLGTIIRTAAAASYTWVLAIGGANIYSPKVLRSAMGGHLALHIRQISFAQLSMVQQHINNLNLPILLTTPYAQQNIYKIPLANNHIWLFGNEGAGVDASWFNLDCIQKVNIPQSSNIESLNVASASAICLYEKVRRSIVE